MKGKINFFAEQISFAIRNKGKLRDWVSKTLDNEGKVLGNVNFIFCNDDYLADLNFKYLKHNTLTDILTFSLDDENGVLSGDIFISLPRIIENAIKYKQKREKEMQRVMIHGVLHLIGYNDASSQQKIEMREKENFYLELFVS